MKTKKTIQTVIKEDEENSFLYWAIRSLLMHMAKKYNVQPNNLLIGMHYGDMVVQVFDHGANPVWQTLEIITLPNHG